VRRINEEILIPPSAAASSAIFAYCSSVKRMFIWRSYWTVSPIAGGILALLYTAVNSRVTQKVMIPPAASNRFGQLIREARERRGLLQEDVAKALGVDRSLISQWERGVTKRPVAVQDVNTLGRYLGVPVLSLVIALGYDVRLSGVEEEAGAALLEAYLLAPDERRQIAQLALGLGQVLSGGGLLESLRRLAATDHQDRPETQE
jgi:transcriptional regulator with XRE-family HTH domain